MIERRTFLLTALACYLALAGIPARVAAQPGTTITVSLPISVVQAFKPTQRIKDCSDIEGAHQRPTGWYCDINAGAQATPSFVLFGDSHAGQLIDVVEAAAKRAHRSGIVTGYSGCPPLLGIYPVNRPDQATRDCNALNRRMVDYVRQTGVKDVILVAKWSYYTDFWNKGSYLNAIGLAKNEPATIAGSRKALTEGFAETVKAYTAMGVRLYVLEQIPQQPAPPDQVYGVAWQVPSQVEQRLQAMSAKRPQHVELQSYAASVFRAYKNTPGITILNADKLFCNAAICSVGTAAKPYYQDQSHLSGYGAALLLPMFTQVLAGKR
jgi:hypothetical protein